MGIAGVRPVEVAEQRVVAEDHILPPGLHAETLDPGEISDQDIGRPDAEPAAPAVVRLTRAHAALCAVVVQRISTVPCVTGVAVSAPRRRVDDLEVEVDVRRQIIADAQAHPLLDVEVVGALGCLIGSGCGSRRRVEGVAGPGRGRAAAEADAVPELRAHAQVGAHPEVFDVEVPADDRIVALVGFFVRHRPRDMGKIGNTFARRKLVPRPGRREEKLQTGNQHGRHKRE